MERFEGLRKINTPEEYSEAKSRLESYLKQYKWITETKTPYEDISKVLIKCSETRKSYEAKEANEEQRQIELENENKILALKLQYDAIKGDTYKGNLRRNIMALYVSIGDYEARMEKRSTKKSIKSQSDTKFDSLPKDMLTSRSMRRFRFWLASVTGMVPGEINMDAENRKEIPLYILKNYDLVNLVANEEITPEQEEKALVVVPEVDLSRGMFYRMIEQPVEQFIASRGIREKGRIETTVEIDEEGISNVTNEFISHETTDVKAPKKDKDQPDHQHSKEEKDEIGQ